MTETRDVLPVSKKIPQISTETAPLTQLGSRPRLPVFGKHFDQAGGDHEQREKGDIEPAPEIIGGAKASARPCVRI